MRSLHCFGPVCHKRGHVGVFVEMAQRFALEVRRTPASYAFRRTLAVAYTYQRTKPTPSLITERRYWCLIERRKQQTMPQSRSGSHSGFWQQEARAPFILAFQNGPGVTLVRKKCFISLVRDSNTVPALEATDVRPLGQWAPPIPLF